MKFAYILALLGVIGTLLIADARLRLAFFDQPRRACLTLAGGLAVFLVWDLLGIAFNIFAEGVSAYALGVYILPHMPLEEPFFLFLLCYLSLLLYRAWEKLWRPTSF